MLQESGEDFPLEQPARFTQGSHLEQPQAGHIWSHFSGYFGVLIPIKRKKGTAHNLLCLAPQTQELIKILFSGQPSAKATAWSSELKCPSIRLQEGRRDPNGLCFESRTDGSKHSSTWAAYFYKLNLCKQLFSGSGVVINP